MSTAADRREYRRLRHIAYGSVQPPGEVSDAREQLEDLEARAHGFQSFDDPEWIRIRRMGNTTNSRGNGRPLA